MSYLSSIGSGAKWLLSTRAVKGALGLGAAAAGAVFAPATAAVVAIGAAGAYAFRKTPVYVAERQINFLAVVNPSETLGVIRDTHTTAKKIFDTSKQHLPPPEIPVLGPVPVPPPIENPSAASSLPPMPITPEQADRLSKQLSATATLWVLNHWFGLGHAVRSLTGIAAESVKSGRGVWETLKENSPPLGWKKPLIYGAYHVCNWLLPNIIETYLEGPLQDIRNQLAGPDAGETLVRFTRASLEKSEKVLRAINSAAEKFANGAPTTQGLTLDECITQAICDLYKNGEERAPSREEAIQRLCQEGSDVFMDSYVPQLSGIAAGAQPLRWIHRSLVKKYILPKLLPQLVETALGYASKDNPSFLAMLRKLAKDQISGLRTQLREGTGSAAPAPVVGPSNGTEKLPPVIGHLQTTIAVLASMSQSTEPAAIKKALNKDALYFKLLFGQDKEIVQQQLINGFSHLFRHLSEPKNASELVGKLIELTNNSFVPKPVSRDFLISSFNEQNLTDLPGDTTAQLSTLLPGNLLTGDSRTINGVTFTLRADNLLSFDMNFECRKKMTVQAQTLLKQEVTGFLDEVIPQGLTAAKKALGADRRSLNLEERTKSGLEAQKTPLQEIFQTLPSTCATMQEKIGRGETIQPEIARLAQSIANNTDEATIQTELNSIPSKAKRDAILRAILPVHQETQAVVRILEEIQKGAIELNRETNKIQENRDLIQQFQTRPWSVEPSLEMQFKREDALQRRLGLLRALIEQFHTANVWGRNTLSTQIQDRLAALSSALPPTDKENLIQKINQYMGKQVALDTIQLGIDELNRASNARQTNYIRQANQQAATLVANMKLEIDRTLPHLDTLKGLSQLEVRRLEGQGAKILSTLQNTKTQLQVEYSGFDAAATGVVTGIAGLFSLPLAAGAAIGGAIATATRPGKELVDQGVNLGAAVIEGVAKREANKFSTKAYELTESDHFYHAAVTLPLRAFIDAKKKR